MKLKPSWVPHPFLHSYKASMNMRLCQLFRGRYKGILHDSKVNNFKLNISLLKASLMAQTVKNLPVMRETWVWPLGWEDPLEQGIATHSIILAWGIPKDRGARQAAVHGVTESDMTERLRMHACFLNYLLITLTPDYFQRSLHPTLQHLQVSLPSYLYISPSKNHHKLLSLGQGANYSPLQPWL